MLFNQVNSTHKCVTGSLGRVYHCKMVYHRCADSCFIELFSDFSLVTQYMKKYGREFENIFMEILCLPLFLVT